MALATTSVSAPGTALILAEEHAAYQHRLQQLKLTLDAAQQAEMSAFAEVKRLQGKIVDLMVRVNDAQVAAQKSSEAVEPAGGPNVDNGRADLATLQTWLEQHRKDYEVAEREWKMRSLETAEVRSMIQDVVEEQSGEVDHVRYDGEHSLDATKPARVTADEIVDVHSPGIRPKSLAQPAYSKTDPRLEENMQGIPISDTQVRKLFDQLDVNRNGYLDKNELQAFFDSRSEGLPLCSNYVERELKRLQPLRKPTDETKVSYSQFAVLVTRWAAM